MAAQAIIRFFKSNTVNAFKVIDILIVREKKLHSRLFISENGVEKSDKVRDVISIVISSINKSHIERKVKCLTVYK